MLGNGLTPGDFRSISSSGSFDLAQGEHKVFTFAFTTHPNVPHPAPDVIPVKETITQVRDLYNIGNPFAEVNLGADQILPNGTTITLDAGTEGVSYVWSTGDNDATIEVNAPGNYSVTVTDGTGCMRTDDVNVTMMTGINDVDVPQFSLFPNPVTKGNNVSIHLADVSEIRSMALSNIIGQQLYAKVLDAKTTNLQFKIKSSLSPGIYLLELSFENGAKGVKKLIVE